MNPSPPNKTEQKEWFSDWFHTPYYDLLYESRNRVEAVAFVQRICALLQMKAGQKLLDVPCGWGRHATALAARGLEVTGLDINPNLIARARQTSQPGLQFAVHDMRRPYAEGGFDYVLNLFTSLGYFDTEADNSAVLRAFAASLRRGGRLVIDFFNAEALRSNFVQKEERKLKEVRFRIQRRIEEPFIHKDIHIQHENQELHFQERVMLLSLDHFLAYFAATGLKLLSTYGNYSFSSFDPRHSDRLILIAEKL